MNYTDNQLKVALAKMLPEQVKFRQFTDDIVEYGDLYWKNKNQHPLQSEVRDTELMHLCNLVEISLSWPQFSSYRKELSKFLMRTESASWQQRVEALAIVKRIDV